MKLQSDFLRIATLPTLSLLLIISGAARQPVCANGLKAESEAERYVLQQFKKGKYADLESEFPSYHFPADKRKVRGIFITALLTDRGAY
jgi:hypothetical protein